MKIICGWGRGACNMENYTTSTGKVESHSSMSSAWHSCPDIPSGGMHDRNVEATYSLSSSSCLAQSILPQQYDETRIILFLRLNSWLGFWNCDLIGGKFSAEGIMLNWGHPWKHWCSMTGVLIRWKYKHTDTKRRVWRHRRWLPVSQEEGLGKYSFTALKTNQCRGLSPSNKVKNQSHEAGIWGYLWLSLKNKNSCLLYNCNE